MPDVPAPESLPTFNERLKPFAKQLGDWARERERPIDIRLCDPLDVPPEEMRDPVAHAWIRADGELPDDPILHTCVLTYASDMTLLDATVRPHGLMWCPDRKLMMASLDHCMWFHRPFRADDYLLYSMDSPSASGARGFSRGSFYTREGELVASTVQESLLRVREKS